MICVGVDCDGILCQFDKGYVPLLREASGLPFPRLGEEGWPDCWNYEEGVTTEQYHKVWEQIKSSDNFWATLPPHEGAETFLFGLKKLDDIEVYFITHRPGETAKKQTEEWLRNHGYDKANVVVTSKKGEACRDLDVDIYIDDKVENCEDVRDTSMTECFMLARPWNKDIDEIYRLASLKEFMDIINQRRLA